MAEHQSARDRREEPAYSSFLIRCWALSGDRLRVKVEHVQSDAWTHCGGMEDALVWIETRCRPRRENEEETAWVTE